jgi:hypothetical protein
MLLRYFVHYGIIFMNMCSYYITFSRHLDEQFTSPNTIVNVRHVWLYDSAVRARRKKIEIKFWR